MIHKWLADLFDFMLYLGIMIGLLLLFGWYWKTEYQVRYAEIMMQEFLDDVSVKGKITLEGYEQLIWNLKRVSPDYEMEVSCIEYVFQPVYGKIPKEELDLYYMQRNVKKEIQIQNNEIWVEEEEIESLSLQVETNAEILAAGCGEYVPLPETGAGVVIEAVRTYQEVYEGEKIITLCRVSSEEGYYYAEAADVQVFESGTVMLNIEIAGKQYKVPVEVLCYPRKVICPNGHEVVNVKSILEKLKQTNYFDCPYCKVIPKEIICSEEVLQKKTGEKMTKEEVGMTVLFLDGHTEWITPDMEEWQDNFDENYCGIQQVIIRYRGKEDTITVVTVNDNCMQCNKACSGRSYPDYKAFPYCTSCMSDALLFTGKICQEERQLKNGEFLARLDSESEVELNAGTLIMLYLTRNDRYEAMIQNEVRKDGKHR